MTSGTPELDDLFTDFDFEAESDRAELADEYLAEAGDVYDVSPYGDRMLWIEDYIANTSEGFKESGCGEWISQIRFSHNRVDDEEMTSFISIMRARISELRQQARQLSQSGGLPPRMFYFVSLQYEIMDDKKNVIWRVARMNATEYQRHRSASRGGWETRKDNAQARRAKLAAKIIME